MLHAWPLKAGRPGARAEGRRRKGAALLFVIYSAAVGSVLTRSPEVAVALAILPVGVLLLIYSAVVRLTFFVGGGMLVLGVNDSLGVDKIAYAAGVAAIAIISAVNLVRDPPSWVGACRPAFVALGFCGALLSLGFVLGPEAQTLVGVRIGISYAFPLVGPLVALDAGRRVRPKSIKIATVVVGLISAVAYGIDWAARRGLLALATDGFAAASLYLPAIGLALAFAWGMKTSGPTRWLLLIVAASIPATMLVSGNRTALIVLIAAVAMLGSSSYGRVQYSRALPMIGLLVVLGGGLLVAVSEYVLNDATVVFRRLESVGSADALASDLSYNARLRQVDFALAAIMERPLMGSGMGYVFGHSMDNGLATVARVGILGAGAIIIYFGLVLRAVLRISEVRGYSVWDALFKALLLLVAISVVLTSPFDDRGFAYAIAMAIAGLASVWSERERHWSSDGSLWGGRALGGD